MDISSHPSYKQMLKDVEVANAKAVEEARELAANNEKIKYDNIQRLQKDIDYVLDEYEELRLLLRAKWREGYQLQQKLLAAGSSAQPFHQQMPALHLPRARLLPTESLYQTFTSGRQDIEMFWALKNKWTDAS